MDPLENMRMSNWKQIRLKGGYALKTKRESEGGREREIKRARIRASERGR